MLWCFHATTLQWRRRDSSCVCHTLFSKLHDFRERRLFKGKCVSILSADFVQNIVNSKNNSVRYDKCTYVGLRIKYPLLFSHFSRTWMILTDFRKILKYEMEEKCVQWKPRCFHEMDRQTWALHSYDRANSCFTQRYERAQQNSQTRVHKKEIIFLKRGYHIRIFIYQFLYFCVWFL